MPTPVIPLTDATWALIEKVNTEVNALPYETDMERWNKPDFWTVLVSGGLDCEDYCLTKRQRLWDAGLDPTHILPAIGWDQNNDGHCVLLVETDKGAYCLDNNSPDVLAWDDPKVSIKKWDRRANADGTWRTFTR